MSRITDFVPGTEYIYLYREDFKNEERYKSYARFMEQDPEWGCVYVPIDTERARKRADIPSTTYADEFFERIKNGSIHS